VVVLALGVVGLAAVAAAPRLPLRLRCAEVGHRVGEAVGLGTRLLVPVGSEVRLFLLAHFGHILPERNKCCCSNLAARASIKQIIASIGNKSIWAVYTQEHNLIIT